MIEPPTVDRLLHLPADIMHGIVCVVSSYVSIIFFGYYRPKMQDLLTKMTKIFIHQTDFHCDNFMAIH